MDPNSNYQYNMDSNYKSLLAAWRHCSCDPHRGGLPGPSPTHRRARSYVFLQMGSMNHTIILKSQSLHSLLKNGTSQLRLILRLSVFKPSCLLCRVELNNT